jgi:hypothetical protein
VSLHVGRSETLGPPDELCKRDVVQAEQRFSLSTFGVEAHLRARFALACRLKRDIVHSAIASHRSHAFPSQKHTYEQGYENCRSTGSRYQYRESEAQNRHISAHGETQGQLFVLFGPPQVVGDERSQTLGTEVEPA